MLLYIHVYLLFCYFVNVNVYDYFKLYIYMVDVIVGGTLVVCKVYVKYTYAYFSMNIHTVIKCFFFKVDKMFVLISSLRM